MSIREIAQNFHNFCPKYPAAFRVFSLLLPKKFHCFCPNFGKSNGKFGQKQWENLGKSNEKTRKAVAHFPGLNYCFFPNFALLLPDLIFAFSRISHCFCPNFPLLLPEFFVFKIWGGGGAQCPPPPPASYGYAVITTNQPQAA